MKKINFKLSSIITFVFILIFSLFFSSSREVLAQTPLVKCGTSATNPCGFNDILVLINTVIHFILYDLAIPIAAIMFAYAGFELVTSGGSTEKKSKAIKIFTNVAIGLIFVAASFLIIKTILSIAGYDQSWNWFGF